MKKKKDVNFRVDGAIDFVEIQGTPTLTDDQAMPHLDRAQMVFDAYLDGWKPSDITDAQRAVWMRGLSALIRENLDAESLPFFVMLAIRNQSSIKALDKAKASHKEDADDKARVFAFLDSVSGTFESDAAAGRAIVKEEPIAHKTAVKWYKEWKNCTSASRG